ncbi:MAG: DUF1109 domain-containing protein [Burkholderiales bacterium]|nr:DUF1109 domain-containing protein [Burkholderiales bacterium]
MKTDDLLVLLAAGAGPVDTRLPVRRFRWALVMATLAGIVVMAASLGVRPTLGRDTGLPMFWFKELFCLALAAIGLVAALRIARPGATRLAWPMALLAALLVVMGAAAGFQLWAAPAQDRLGVWLGLSWNQCPFNIVVLSAPFFIALIWGMKQLAPTRLRLAGAIAGFGSGAMGALVYSLHCPELTAPFIVTWYVLGMLVSTGLGALLGPRLLRW